MGIWDNATRCRFGLAAVRQSNPMRIRSDAGRAIGSTVRTLPIGTRTRGRRQEDGVPTTMAAPPHLRLTVRTCAKPDVGPSRNR